MTLSIPGPCWHFPWHKQCNVKLPQGVAGRDEMWQPLLLHMDSQATLAVQWD